MAYRRPPNPNTAYGRRRIREDYYQRKAEMTPEQRSQQNTTEAWIYIAFIVVIGAIIFAIGGSGALLDWLTH